MVKVKSTSVSQKNYEMSTADVPRRFEEGVKIASWQSKAVEGQDLYEAKMSDPSVLARRARAIEKVSDEQWRSETISKGRGIIAARMKEAKEKWARNWEPYRAVLEATSLPPRTADPLANLTNRAGAIVSALVEEKKRQLG